MDAWLVLLGAEKPSLPTPAAYTLVCCGKVVKTPGEVDVLMGFDQDPSARATGVTREIKMRLWQIMVDQQHVSVDATKTCVKRAGDHGDVERQTWQSWYSRNSSAHCERKRAQWQLDRRVYLQHGTWLRKIEPDLRIKALTACVGLDDEILAALIRYQRKQDSARQATRRMRAAHRQGDAA